MNKKGGSNAHSKPAVQLLRNATQFFPLPSFHLLNNTYWIATIKRITTIPTHNLSQPKKPGQPVLPQSKPSAILLVATAILSGAIWMPERLAACTKHSCPERSSNCTIHTEPVAKTWHPWPTAHEWPPKSMLANAANCPLASRPPSLMAFASFASTGAFKCRGSLIRNYGKSTPRRLWRKKILPMNKT